ncbi:hypothetical protein CCAND95_360014 [Capnocytophaga canis]|nr:hypothetical protein CCAND95_360014 [Capnocytophaga canis]
MILSSQKIYQLIYAWSNNHNLEFLTFEMTPSVFGVLFSYRT